MDFKEGAANAFLAINEHLQEGNYQDLKKNNLVAPKLLEFLKVKYERNKEKKHGGAYH